MLPYNPEEAVDEKSPTIEPGIYPFFVEKSEEKHYKEKEYTNLTLKVTVGDREVTCFDSMYYTPKALFRIAQFAECTNIDKPTEHSHYEGASGTANFVLNDKGFLSVRWYVTDKVPVKAAQTSTTTTQEEIDTIPF